LEAPLRPVGAGLRIFELNDGTRNKDVLAEAEELKTTAEKLEAEVMTAVLGKV
jgi:hypothetical protein